MNKLVSISGLSPELLHLRSPALGQYTGGMDMLLVCGCLWAALHRVKQQSGGGRLSGDLTLGRKLWTHCPFG